MKKNFLTRPDCCKMNGRKNRPAPYYIGGEIYYGAIYGDSSLVPALVDPDIDLRWTLINFIFSVSDRVSVMLTRLFIKNIFLSWDLQRLTSHCVYSTEISTSLDQKASHFGFQPNYIVHAGMGYNGNKWSLSVLWVDSEFFLKGAGSAYKYKISVGNYRLVFAKRFNLDRKTKKLLEPIPKSWKVILV